MRLIILFKAIINSGDGATNARTIYNLIMAAIDVKILFLSGTPITKDPFELVCCVNMLTGSETLPGSYDTFVEQYVNNKIHIKNKNKLQNRLLGLISYVQFELPMHPDSKEKTLEETGRPKDLGIKVERIEMSATQYVRYMSIREKEEKLSMGRSTRKGNIGEGVRDTTHMSLPHSKKGGSSYHIESRMISNFSLPLEICYIKILGKLITNILLEIILQKYLD